MAVFSQLRYPTTVAAKLASALLALILLVFVSLGAISGLLLHQILRPPRSTTSFDLGLMMGHPSTFSYPVQGVGMRDGWFFPGLRRAPTIILCHSYLAQRTEILTLGSALQEHQFNVFLFDFSGHGLSAGVTSLGYREVDELRSALQALAGRDDVDPNRFGIWGMDMGGYAALELATSDKRVAALAVDSVYDDPKDMVRIEAGRSGLEVIPFVTRFTVFDFELFNYPFRREPPVSKRFMRLQGVPKLFIESEDRPILADSTFRLFMIAPEPKQQERERLRYSQMGDDERKTYENLIVTFFLGSIPPAQPARTSR